MILKKRTAIVTGGGQGIGRAICGIFAEEGAAVVVVDINESAAEETARQLNRKGYAGRSAQAVRADISVAAEISALVDGVVEEYGRVDILVNNAGLALFRSVEDCSEEEWDRVMAVNLKGPFLLSKALLPTMTAQRSGAVINLASVAGKTGGVVSGAPYSVSKAGIECLTKSLARELAPHGVRVNAIAPGIIDTALTAHHDPAFVDAIPLGGSKGEPRDVAEAALFLASDRSRHITGEILDVNGGLLMD
ncbi:MAG: SDR family oxidoreductase [Gemmatimonadetes bacterium]|nr:SDR family oxidoreductase [Gemmatimonadota bacterium]MYG86103.1 SDR family oxidoreductase [Gemmatimonadota bacterium]MYJ90397.1 SDR family oxidoreductase [Gemmatimonadota bacterium]